MDPVSTVRSMVDEIQTEAMKDRPFVDTATQILRIGQNRLGVDCAYVTRTDQETNFWKIIASSDAGDQYVPVGLVRELDTTLCQRVVSSGLQAIDDTANHDGGYEADLDTIGTTAYLGFPLHQSEDVYGTVCFVNNESGSRSFTTEDVLVAEVVVQEIEFAIYRERAEEQLQHLNDFVSMISHDLRNPLTVARGWVEAELMNGENAALEKSMVALDRMEELIVDGVEMAREARPVTETEELSLEAIATSCWGGGATPSSNLEIDGELVFAGHQPRVKRLFENLFRNAVVHGGDNLIVRVGPLDDGSGFYVADSGEGIPIDNRERIFDKGYSTDSGSPGLGLAIVKAVVDAHDWDIVVVDSMEGGARFEVHNVIVAVED